METLAKLFGGLNKVKIMRLFLLNPELSLDGKAIAERCRLKPTAVSRELKTLATVGLITLRKKGSEKWWRLDPSFPFISALKSILKSDLVGRNKNLLQRFSRSGRISLLIISGLFLDDNEGRADLLVVGSQLKRNTIAKVIKELEAEIGQELKYAVLETADFEYRLNAWDKFVRDILDYPHSVIVDKLGLAEKSPTFLTRLSTVH